MQHYLLQHYSLRNFAANQTQTLMNFNLVSFLAGLLDGLVDGFKLKNPRAFMALALVLFLCFQAIDFLLASGQVTEVVINLLGMDIPLLGTIKGLIVALGFISGAHTPRIAVTELIKPWEVLKDYGIGDVVLFDDSSTGSKQFKSVKAHTAVYGNMPISNVGIGEYWEEVIPK